MKTIIKNIESLEVLDSRGNPTVRTYVELEDGTKTFSTVPSGASTGMNEAVELRDNEERYGGKGVKSACMNVENIIAKEIKGMNSTKQMEIDSIMNELDGTESKSNLGANAILSVSMAVAKASALSLGIPLFQYLGGSNACRIPVPCMNILNGGEHADNSVDFQEFMLVPLGAPCFAEGLRYVAEIFHTLKAILKDKGLATSVGDEGGFAPNCSSNEEAIEFIVMAIEKAGYKPGIDVSIAVDSAANSFSPNLDNHYNMIWSGAGEMSSDDLIDLSSSWLDKYPIVLWEDPMSEGDWDGFSRFTQKFGDKIEVVGDDIFVTNTKFIKKGIELGTANSALIKLNQIGTVSETIQAVRLCREAGWRYFLSHRSGETEDTFLSDFAVAMDGGHLKTGSACRGERIAKYNRLLEIERILAGKSEYRWK
ncbi:phosphopyruvate hydratase [Aureibacter tunicatorum]|uniref:Enolase n=1 Tax=Aureibacter tunicatorum TaxID=866807 RepID=A0AAE4BPJ2_9BACT|nr:phosphopyruvate hydratase [Aureibacter tunicatorum]MDR6238044.1 enolase [Aureibacter tunicatorum]BDD03077.1 enolase [Aureibacter tunicatorum]